MFDAKKILLLLALSSASLQAQQSISPAQPSATAVAGGRAGLFTIPEAQLRTTVPQIHHQYLGLGGALLRDTYLSPLRYGGKAFSYISEVTRLGYQRRADSVEAAGSLFSYHGRQADQRWRRHTLLTVDLGLTTNPAGNASIYTLQGRYDWGYLRQLYTGKWGTLSVGGSLSALAGVRYSTRNGNNPASLDFGLSIGPSLLYSKRLGGEKLPMLAKLYLRSGLLGTTFSQEFGETYYELYYYSKPLKRFSLAHPGNAPELQLLTSLDLPVLDYLTLSVGYRWDYREKRLHHLRSGYSQHSLLIGVSTTLLPLQGRRVRSTHSSSLPF